MKKIHIALSTHNLKQSIDEYSQRLSAQPIIVVEKEYALWRTKTVNFSIRFDQKCPSGTLRHLGWEDDDAVEFTQETDVNGVTWEYFNWQHQLEEIQSLWKLENS